MLPSGTLHLNFSVVVDKRLYMDCSSPFMDQPSSVEPNFAIPSCYSMNPPHLKGEHLVKFQQETLFYMFYELPRDLLQAYAAQELYRRDWRYHGELKVWMKMRSPQDLMQSHPTLNFVYFDVSSWEVRLFTAAYRGNLAAGMLSIDEIQVKSSPSVNQLMSSIPNQHPLGNS